VDADASTLTHERRSDAIATYHDDQNTQFEVALYVRTYSGAFGVTRLNDRVLSR